MDNSTLIGCARMYAVTEAAADAWRRILHRVSVESGVPLEIIDYPPPAAMETLWSRPNLGAVFMCGYPYAMAGFRHRLIVAPVPAPARYDKKPMYFTDFVVRRDSRFTNLAETFGKTLAWTVSHSHSGYNAVRYHLLSYRTPDRLNLYASTLGPLLTPAAAAQSVIDGKAEVAPLDSWVYDIWQAEGDERAKKCRVVESTLAAPIPPLVASPNIAPGICNRLKQAFLYLHRHSDMQLCLQTLALSHFSAVDAEDYRVIASRAEMAKRVGYLAPA